MISRVALRRTSLRLRQDSTIVIFAPPTNHIISSSSVTSVRSPSSRTFHQPRTSPVQTSVGGPVAYIVAAAAAVTYAYIVTLQFDRPKDVERRRGQRRLEEEEKYAIMTGGPLPGRPGNLTAEQEAKLQEFWTAALHVFGIPELSNGTNTSSEGALTVKDVENKSHAETNASDKKKKKRISIFSRKHHEDEDGTSGSAAEGEDKYGQTKEFHKVLENQTPEELRLAFWSMVKHDNPDALLLRFLRARKWNVQNALIMLVATMHWRQQEMHVDDDIIWRGEGGALADSKSSTAATKKEGEDFLAQMRMGKSYLHGTDKEGRPICFVKACLHRAGEQTESSLERYTVYTIETARLLLTSNVDTAVSPTDCYLFPLRS